MDGVVFKKSGAITGGSSELKIKAKAWDELNINKLIDLQAQLNLEIRKSLRILQKEENLSENTSKLKTLESRNEILLNSINSLKNSLKREIELKEN